jgi:hypothetical protein
MRANRTVAKTWGTWYTTDGERADGWAAERAGGAAAPARDSRVLLASPKYALGGACDGLSAVFSGVRNGGGALAGVL